MATILDLPYVAFLEIMTRLEWSDILSSSLVCKAWHRLINRDKLLHKTLGTVVRFKGPEEFNKGFEFYARNCPQFAVKRLCIEDVLVKYDKSLWDGMLPELTRLHLSSCKLMSKDLEEILCRCSSLAELSLCHVEVIDSSHHQFLGNSETSKSLRNVTQLQLLRGNFDNFEILRLFECFPRLAALEMTSFGKAPMASVIDKVRTTLKKLWLHGATEEYGQLYEKMARMEGLKLTHLKVGRIQFKVDPSIIDLLNSQRGLVYFGMDVNRWTFQDNETDHVLKAFLTKICEATRQVKALHIDHLVANKDSLANHRKLEFLDLEFHEISEGDDGFLGLTKSKSMQTLQTLRISCFEGKVPSNIFSLMPNLRDLELHLGYTSAEQQNLVLQAIVDNAPKLRSFVSDFYQLNYQDIARTRNQGQESGYPEALRNLVHLSLFRSSVTDLSFMDSCQFKNLRSLDISECKNISDLGIKHLTERNPQLELICAMRTSITDEGVKSIAQNLQRLVKLSLLNCRSLTAKTLELFPGNAKFLRLLQLSPENDIKGPEASALQVRMPRLTLSILKTSDDHPEYIERAKLFRNGNMSNFLKFPN